MKIGFIGLGIMGESMCENIVKKHNDKVYVSDHKKSQIEKLAGFGAVPCSSNTEVAENADVIITMVPKSEHVKEVYTEILPVIDSTKICIDMSTIDPAVSVECANMIKAKGAQFADCPVVKSKSAAIDGTLGILIGADEELVPVIYPILSYMGSNIKYMGGNGRGLVMKICSNAMVAAVQNGVNETMALAQKWGVSIDDYAEAISYGSGKNFYLEIQKDNLKNENWNTAFSLENEHKDLGICKRMADEVGFNMPGLNVCRDVYAKGMETGMGKLDFRSTYKIVKGE